MAADSIDVHVGQRMRRRRKLSRQTQAELALALGVTFQQIQKYESGANRLSASQIYRAAGAQGVPVGYYFDGLKDGQSTPRTPDQQLADAWIAGPEPAELAPIMAPMPPELRRDGLCGVLPALVERTAAGGIQFTSAWLPTPEELAALAAGSAVLLTIQAPSHPVVSIGVAAPPEEGRVDG